MPLNAGTDAADVDVRRRLPIATYLLSEFRDVVFEDVVIDNNRFDIDVTIETIYNRVTKLLLSNNTSSNTTSLNSRTSLLRIHCRPSSATR